MWKYKNEEIKDINSVPEGAFGFVYEVYHIPSGKKYIGRKQLISVITKALGKKELAELTDKRASKKRKFLKRVIGKTIMVHTLKSNNLLKMEKKKSSKELFFNSRFLQNISLIWKQNIFFHLKF